MIHKIGLLVVRDNRVLLCRKRRGTTLLILPGGKPEAGESEEQALAREIREELDAGVNAIEHFGNYEDEAAGEARRVRISLYKGVLDGERWRAARLGSWSGLGPGTTGS